MPIRHPFSSWLLRQKVLTLPHVRQVLFWTGPGENPYGNRFEHDGLSLEFESIDLKGHFGGGQSLRDRKSPTDKILGLLCMQKADSEEEKERQFQAWQDVARWLVTTQLLDDGRFGYRALFEFAAKMRNLDVRKIIRGIEGWNKMPMTFDFDGTIVAKQIHDHGIAKGIVMGQATGEENALRRVILETLEDLGIQDARRRFGATLSQFDRDQLSIVRQVSRNDPDADAIIAAIKDPWANRSEPPSSGGMTPGE